MRTVTRFEINTRDQHIVYEEASPLDEVCRQVSSKRSPNQVTSKTFPRLSHVQPRDKAPCVCQCKRIKVTSNEHDPMTQKKQRN